MSIHEESIEAVASEFDFNGQEWREYQSIPDQGYSHRSWLDHRNRQTIKRLIESGILIVNHAEVTGDDKGIVNSPPAERWRAFDQGYKGCAPARSRSQAEQVAAELNAEAEDAGIRGQWIVQRRLVSEWLDVD